MATRRRTEFDDLENEQELERSTLLLEPTPEPPQPTQVYFPALHNYAADRRFDVRARDYNDCIKLPYKDGYLEKFNRIADPGYYFVELRAVNKIVGDKGVHTVAPNVSGEAQATSSAQPTSSTQAAAPVAEHSTARAVNEAADTVRAIKEFAREVAPPATTQAPPITKEDVAQMVEQSTSKLLTQLLSSLPQQQQPPSLVTQIKELAEVKSQLQTLGIFPDTKPTASEDDEETLLARAVINRSGVFEEIIENLSGIARVGERSPWYSRMFERVAEAGAQALAPLAVTYLQSKFMQSAPPASPGQVSPQPAPPAVDQQRAAEFMESFQVTVNDAFVDMTEGKPVDETAEDFIKLIQEFPDFAGVIQNMMNTPSPHLITSLAEQGAQIEASPENVAWLDTLKLAVQTGLRPPAPPPPPSNGHREVAPVNAS